MSCNAVHSHRVWIGGEPQVYDWKTDKLCEKTYSTAIDDHIDLFYGGDCNVYVRRRIHNITDIQRYLEHKYFDKIYPKKWNQKR